MSGNPYPRRTVFHTSGKFKVTKTAMTRTIMTTLTNLEVNHTAVVEESPIKRISQRMCVLR